MTPWRDEARAQLRLALPLVVVQVGMMAMGVVDVVMVGHYGSVDLAAVSLGNAFSFGCLSMGLGILMALDPIVSQAAGARDQSAVALALQRGLVLGAGLTLPTAAATLAVGPVLTALGQPPEVVPLAAGYAHATIPGIPFFFLFVALRQTLQATGRIRPIVLVILTANIANVLLNRVFIFGALGVPAMGGVGAAWTTSAVRLLMAVCLLGFSWPLLRPLLRPFSRRSLALAPLGRMLRLGVPVGAQIMLEITAFNSIAVFMGWMGTGQIAGHQVALNLASLTFMVPLGLSTAAAVRVGWGVGRADMPAVRRAAGVALCGGVSFMACMAALFVSFPEALAGLYTEEAAIVAVAAALIPMAGAFQIFDGTQVVAMGILRGCADTRTPMVVSLLGYWVFGLPLGLWLAFSRDQGPVGLWVGLVAALFVVAVVLLARVRFRLRRAVARVMMDAPLADEEQG